MLFFLFCRKPSSSFGYLQIFELRKIDPTVHQNVWVYTVQSTDTGWVLGIAEGHPPLFSACFRYLSAPTHLIQAVCHVLLRYHFKV